MILPALAARRAAGRRAGVRHGIPRLAAVLGVAASSLACAVPAAPTSSYAHNRHDYETFRDRVADLLEPNYLPFVATPLRWPPETSWTRLRRALGLAPLEGAGTYLVFCRFSDADLPLRVAVVPPVIPAELDDEPAATSPEDYVSAVEAALALWEQSLEGGVRFERSDDPRDAALVLRLLGEEAPVPEPEVQVLGAARLRDACRVTGGDPRNGRVEVRYAVSELRVFVRDRHGLLLPDQVEKITLHEIGHALGMWGHSPIPADLMYEVVRDRLPRGELGSEDVNTFLSLYAIPSGTVYRKLPDHEGWRRADTRGPRGAPRLSPAPHVDPRLGYEVQLPEGWTRVPMRHGVVAVDGVTWDYDVSYQVLVHRYPDLEAYFERHGARHLGRGPVVEAEEGERDGRRSLRVRLAEQPSGLVEELTFLESGDGRVVVVIAECPAELRSAWEPWFDAILASLELRGPGDRELRDY